MAQEKSPRGPERSLESALGLLGLARRAGALSLGVDGTRQSLDSGRVRLVLLAADASHKQLDKVRGRALGDEVPVRWVPDQMSMGAAVGSGPLSVVGVLSESFAEQLLRSLPAESPPPEGGSEERSIGGNE